MVRVLRSFKAQKDINSPDNTIHYENMVERISILMRDATENEILPSVEMIYSNLENFPTDKLAILETAMIKGLDKFHTSI